ncbi:MAG: ATP-binding cassette domain-containing protein, partial [Deinococcales bacterium]|nr:ATP-binding cassette domain-containing protein [Chitinophagaceae bacterium]
MVHINAPINHLAIFLSNNSHSQLLVHQLLSGNTKAPFEAINGLKGVLFSTITLQAFIEEEAKHKYTDIVKNTQQTLQSMSSGERKKALLAYLLLQQPTFIILENPFDNLDMVSQQSLLQNLIAISHNITVIQLVSRKADLLPFITNTINLNHNIPTILNNYEAFIGNIPPPLKQYNSSTTNLVAFKNVTVKHEERTIVKNNNWLINAGEFWQLVGPNGAGKTTLLTMINGDHPKAYGQDLWLFGNRKGSGECVWDIKEKIGYLN